MIDIKQLEEDLYKLGLTKFDMEGKIESIEHQLEMSLYRKENGEEVNGKNEEIEGVKFENRREDTGSRKQD